MLKRHELRSSKTANFNEAIHTTVLKELAAEGSFITKKQNFDNEISVEDSGPPSGSIDREWDDCSELQEDMDSFMRENDLAKE